MMKTEMAYLAYDPRCGCVSVVVPDNSEGRAELVKLVGAGLALERLPMVEANAMFARKIDCPIHKRNRPDPVLQKTLPGFD